MIPGRVAPDLLNEHLGRYSFAETLVKGKSVLDAGCGVGYGSARLAALSDQVYALDNAAEAVCSGRAQYPQARFIQGDCSRLPFRDSALDTVVAFEVIEHLEDWQALIREAARVLRPAGMFLVSTPNRVYYTDSRDEPNPFHIHEFDYEEFREELAKYFSHQMIFLENHANAITFMPETVEDTRTRVEPSPADPAGAHFFLAVCSHSPLSGLPGFVYLPRGGNVLRDREQHIKKLKSELLQKTRWLEDATAELEKLTRMHRSLEAENQKKTRWAEDLNTELRRAAELLDEAEARVMERTEWARQIETEKQTLHQERKRTVELLDEAEARVIERTEWAQRLDHEFAAYRERIEAIRATPAYRVARKLGLLPAAAEETSTE